MLLDDICFGIIEFMENFCIWDGIRNFTEIINFGSLLFI